MTEVYLVRAHYGNEMSVEAVCASFERGCERAASYCRMYFDGFEINTAGEYICKRYSFRYVDVVPKVVIQ